MISNFCRVVRTKSMRFRIYIFFPIRFLYAYDFSAVNHLLLSEVKVLFHVRFGAFVGYISSTFFSCTRVFSSFFYRLFNNNGCNILIFNVLFFILPHFGTVLLHFGTVLPHFGTLIFYFTTLWYHFYLTLALEIGFLFFRFLNTLEDFLLSI